jgi:hypothetical protein
MKAKSSLFLVLLLALGMTMACNRAPNDAQIANQVQSRITADSNIQNKQIGVQSANGVVTLSGTVASELERSAAANDAAQISGVKTVVNDLQVSQSAMAQPAPAPMEQPAPAARTASRRRHPAPRSARDHSRPSAATYAAPAGNMASAPAAAAAPAPRRVVTVPEGTGFSVRLVDPIDTERNKVGDTFRATVSQPVMIGDEVVIPTDADVEGRVVASKSAGHFEGQSAIALTLTRLRMNGKTYALRTNQYDKQGASRGKRTAATVGGGAALGAIIGGIAGGGKGAAIGAGVGAGAGTGVQAATKGQQIKLPSETVLNFRLESALNVTPASASDRNAGRQRVDQ